jgi:hypothetical protein
MCQLPNWSKGGCDAPLMPYTDSISREPMKNTHLEHPEDTILTGDLSVLDWFVTPGNLSVKIDGAPAIVFGTHPENGQFFVGTKSVFNKKKIKVCYTQEDVFALYDEATHASLIEILCACLKYLPRISGIVQADFIGFGGSTEYTPNTITYQFPEVVRQTIILAPHTFYTCEGKLCDAEAFPLIHSNLFDTNDVKFIRPEAYILHDPWNRSTGTVCFDDVEQAVKFARVMALAVEFVSDKEAAKIKQQINACIRAGEEISTESVKQFDCDPNLIGLWALVKSIKDDCLFLCRNDGPAAYINGNRIDAEGYVLTNEFGMFKLINREVFTYANFNFGKFQLAKN